MSDIRDMTDALLKFRDERDWAQFHNSKDLAIALNIESSELLELFLWKPAENAERERVKEELADILSYALAGICGCIYGARSVAGNVMQAARNAEACSRTE